MVLNLRDKDLKDLKTLKLAIRKQLRKHKIGIREDLSESFLKKLFLEVKERIKLKTKHKVDRLDFPKDSLIVWLFWKRGWRRLLKIVFLTQSENERERTAQSWREEYPTEKPTFEKKTKRTKSVLIPLHFKKEENPKFFFIGLSSKNESSLRHELTHYFENTLNLPKGSLQSIWL